MLDKQNVTNQLVKTKTNIWCLNSEEKKSHCFSPFLAKFKRNQFAYTQWAEGGQQTTRFLWIILNRIFFSLSLHTFLKFRTRYFVRDKIIHNCQSLHTPHCSTAYMFSGIFQMKIHDPIQLKYSCRSSSTTIIKTIMVSVDCSHTT